MTLNAKAAWYVDMRTAAGRTATGVNLTAVQVRKRYSNSYSTLSKKHSVNLGNKNKQYLFFKEP